MSDKPVVLSRDTLLPVGAVVAILAAGWWFYEKVDARMADRMNAITVKLEAQDRLVNELKDSLKDLRYELREQSTKTADRWSMTNMNMWALKFQAANPTLSVPSPSDIIVR